MHMCLAVFVEHYRWCTQLYVQVWHFSWSVYIPLAVEWLCSRMCAVYPREGTVGHRSTWTSWW